MKLHDAEVVSRERFGDHVLLRYRWTQEDPEPGQFVMARSKEPSGQVLDPFLSRPFFAHEHTGGVTSLLFEVRGRGTALLAEGDARLAVSAPLGRGFVLEDDGPVALVGGGVWVAPLKLLGERLSRLGVPYDIYLEVPQSAPKAYGAWLSKGYPGAILVPTSGAPGASQTVLDHIGPLGRYSALYASGPAEMLAAVKRVAEGVVSAQLALRERMACANGSCYGCAVPVWSGGEKAYARACIDGPVFGAEALAW